MHFELKTRQKCTMLVRKCCKWHTRIQNTGCRTLWKCVILQGVWCIPVGVCIYIIYFDNTCILKGWMIWHVLSFCRRKFIFTRRLYWGNEFKQVFSSVSGFSDLKVIDHNLLIPCTWLLILLFWVFYFINYNTNCCFRE